MLRETKQNKVVASLRKCAEADYLEKQLEMPAEQQTPGTHCGLLRVFHAFSLNPIQKCQEDTALVDIRAVCVT